jgi:hypothetical protein
MAGTYRASARICIAPGVVTKSRADVLSGWLWLAGVTGTGNGRARKHLSSDYNQLLRFYRATLRIAPSLDMMQCASCSGEL